MNRHALALGLALVLAPVGLVRAQSTQSATSAPAAAARWEPDIRKFEESDRTSPPPKQGILFLGSSSIRMWSTLARDFPGLPVINRGFGGSTVSDVLAFVDRIVLPYEPRIIVFYCGTNDIAGGTKPNTVIAETTRLFQRVHARLPQTLIGYVSMAPAPSRWEHRADFRQVNEAMQALARKDPKVRYLDLWSQEVDTSGQPRPELFQDDRLHPSPAGYEVWKRVVGDFLQKNWAAAR